MSLIDRIKNVFRPAKAPTVRLSFLAGQRSRVTTDTPNDSPFHRFAAITAPPDPIYDWRLEDLDDHTLARISVSRLVELLIDVSPEINRALWDFLRFCNPGYSVKTFRPGSEAEFTRGQAVIEAMIDRLNDYYGSFDVVIGRLFVGAFARGAFLGELVLNETGREFVDLATPDPITARFRKIDDPDRGQVWQLGQWQDGAFVPLDMETVRYIPVDPFPGKPYGRPFITAAIFPALFLIGLLHDLRRVVSQQGYPRLDLEIDLEALKEAMPADIESDAAKWKTWINEVVDEVGTVYSTLQPDDAYVHTSVIKVNRPVGAVDADSLGAIDGLIRGLERMVTRALKSMPLLMGSNEATSETHANRQWEIHVAGIKALQHMCETLLERLFETALRAQGLQATVEFRFAELRASERLRDAQAEAMEIANESAKYQAGWVSQDEASEAITGGLADVPEPRTKSTGLTLMNDDGDGQEAAGTAVQTNGRVRL